jgi:hypothetical protein
LYLVCILVLRGGRIGLRRCQTGTAAKLKHLPQEQLIESIVAKERRILGIMEEIKGLLASRPKTAV